MLGATEDGKLASALASVNCLVISALANKRQEVAILIDLVKAQRVEKKELLIFTEIAGA